MICWSVPVYLTRYESSSASFDWRYHLNQRKRKYSVIHPFLNFSPCICHFFSPLRTIPERCPFACKRNRKKSPRFQQSLIAYLFFFFLLSFWNPRETAKLYFLLFLRSASVIVSLVNRVLCTQRQINVKYSFSRD